MALRGNRYVVLTEDGPVKRAGESWSAVLRRWLVECPRCSEVWLVVGARENDRHVCKGCGHGFAIRFPVAPEDELSPVGHGGTRAPVIRYECEKERHVI